MTRSRTRLAAAAMVALAASTAWALDAGDKAPALSMKKWVANTPVTARSARGKVLVVEFWATWCPPCRTTIPHLNKLHKKYGDKKVIICGITNENASTVQKFMKSTPMKYHIGIDTGKTAAAYMKGIPGIPHAFVVDPTGKVSWHGHPMAGLDQAIEQALAKSPAGASAVDVEGLEPLEAALKLALTDDLAGRDLEQALKLARKAYNDSGKKSAKALGVLARVHYEMGHLNTAARAADKAATLATGDEAEKLQAAAQYYRRELERRRNDPAAKL